MIFYLIAIAIFIFVNVFIQISISNIYYVIIFVSEFLVIVFILCEDSFRVFILYWFFSVGFLNAIFEILCGFHLWFLRHVVDQLVF